MVWTKLLHSNGEILFGSFYRQPGSTVDIMEQRILSMCNLRELAGIGGSHHMVILGGNFTFPDINWENGSIRSKPQYAKAINEKMLDIVDNVNLIQLNGS